MAAVSRFFTGVGLALLGVFLLGVGTSRADATETARVVNGGLIFALGVTVVYMVTSDWLKSEEEIKH